MAARESQARWVLAGVVVLVVGIGAWWMLAERPGVPEAVAPAPGDLSAGRTPEAVPSVPAVPAPAQQIAENGRLTATVSAMREGEVLALGLGMSDVARGSGVRDVKIVDVSGRVLEVKGVPIDGAGTGMRIEIEPDWLVPGRYLIQVATAEPRPLALNRYVLKVEPERTDAGTQPTDE